MVAGTCRGLPPPFPVVTATYCFPLILNVTGKPCTDVDSRVSQRILPVFTSKALNRRSRSPTNATPPAVETTAVMNGARCVYAHISFIVFTSNAASLPMWPSVAGISKKRRRSEEHTSELQSLAYLVCRLLLEKKKKQ